MNDVVAALDRCVPAQEAIARLASEHKRRAPSLTSIACEERAIEGLLPRLRNGVLDAWAVNCSIESSVDTGPLGVHEIVSAWDYYSHNGEAQKIPIEFWRHFHIAGQGCRSFDVISGDCSFSYFDDEFSQRDGSAFAIHFDQKGLPALVSGQRLAGSPEAGPDVFDLQAQIANQQACIASLEEQNKMLVTECTRLSVKLGELQRLEPAISDTQKNGEVESRLSDLPRLPDGLLASWWEWLDDGERSLGHDLLWDLARASFPRHSISRQRIRELDPHRKRGPKPIRGKNTA